MKLIGYLKINRTDMAEQVYKQMRNVDDDNALTTLAQVWIKVTCLVLITYSYMQVAPNLH